MKTSLALIILLTCLIISPISAQTRTTTVHDANGYLVGSVASYTNYIGETQTILYDDNSFIVGSIHGSMLSGGYYPVSFPLGYYSYGPSGDQIAGMLSDYLDKYPEYSNVWLWHSNKIQKKIRKLRKKQTPESDIIQTKLALIEKYMIKEGDHPKEIEEAKRLSLEKYNN